MFLFGENGLYVRTTITSNCTQLHALALQEAIECYSTTKYSKTFRSNSKEHHKIVREMIFSLSGAPPQKGNYFSRNKPMKLNRSFVSMEKKSF